MVPKLLRFTIIFAIASLLFLGYAFFTNKAEGNANIKDLFIASTQNIALQTNQTEGDITPGEKTFAEFTEETIDPNGFYLRIDKINLFKRIVKNVDPSNKETYVKSWEAGISHGKYTATPDKIGVTYLFAHALGNKAEAINQNAWFSNLDQLESGDTVMVYYEGYRYTYVVSQIFAVSPSATSYYTGAGPVAQLRMQYCGPPTGSLESRTLVDALLIDKQLI